MRNTPSNLELKAEDHFGQAARQQLVTFYRAPLAAPLTEIHCHHRRPLHNHWNDRGTRPVAGALHVTTQDGTY